MKTPPIETVSSSEESTLTSAPDPSNAQNSPESTNPKRSSGRRLSNASLPLSDAKKRLNSAGKRGKGYRRIKYVSGEAVNTEVAALKASGLNSYKIARALDISRVQVDNITKLPDFPDRVKKMRDAIKLVALSGIWNVHEKAWNLVEQSLDNGDAKAFDASTRGLGALEKIAASASGENKPAQINVQVANVEMARQEAQDLLRALLSDNESAS